MALHEWREDTKVVKVALSLTHRGVGGGGVVRLSDIHCGIGCGLAVCVGLKRRSVV